MPASEPTPTMDPDQALLDYHAALRSAPPAVLRAGHATALAAVEEREVRELRRRLDRRLTRPVGAGDSSAEAVAADLTQLAVTGLSAVTHFLADPGLDEDGVAHPLDVTRLAVAFVASPAWQEHVAQSAGGRRSVDWGRRLDEADRRHGWATPGL